MGGPHGQVDFFISYTSTDRAWAEWIAWQLKETGSSVVLQAWDMVPGLDFAHEMQKATTTAKRTLAVLSPAYFTSQFSEAEWRAAFATDPSGEQRRLIPVRVVDFTPEGLLATRIYIDLVGKDRHAARTALLEGVRGQPAAVPAEEPAFPGEQPAAVEVFTPAQEEPRLPSALPRVWKVPYPRNWSFTGREDLLEELVAGVGEGAATAITQAIAGLGGVGKTSLAVEYPYRQQATLDVVWWVRAEEPATLISDFTALADALDLPERSQRDPAVVVGAVHRWLAAHGRWLLVFDNVTRPEDVATLLPPGGGGQVLVTSRWAAWGEWARPLRLEVLSRKESVAFLRKRTGASDKRAVAALAEALGDLPLALAEAAAYIEQTQVGLDAYLRLVQERAVELFGLRQPTGAHRRVATVWSLSLERVEQEAPAAEALLDLCAFLAPEDIPRNLLGEHPQVLPEKLRELARDVLAYNHVLGVLSGYSLATVSPTALGLHRLVQAVIRGRLTEDKQSYWTEIGINLLRGSFPPEPDKVTTWPICQQLFPHLVAVTDHAERLEIARSEEGWLLDRASRFLLARGQYQEARPLAERAIKLGEATLGPDHLDMARWYNTLGTVLFRLRDLDGARTEHERALEIGEATLGSDHSNMAFWHNNLGVVLRQLGDLDGARSHLERALEIGQATIGPDHPDMAGFRRNLSDVLRKLGGE